MRSSTGSVTKSRSQRSGSLLDSTDASSRSSSTASSSRFTALPDGSVQLVGDNGQVAKTVAKDAFKPGAERSPFYLTLMLIAL